ncbi:MAG: hypothetical protein IPJ65_23595 [Archangiaceae bacterium]|nr:hypothetical protein [Archangiaceae bacterium]
MNIRTENTRTVDFLFDGRTLRARFVENAEVTGADAREHLGVMSRLTGGQKARVLVDLRAARSQSREARQLYSGAESDAHTCCCALVVGSPISRVLGSFFLGLNKPRYPTRIFTSPEDAERWLEQFDDARRDER